MEIEIHENHIVVRGSEKQTLKNNIEAVRYFINSLKKEGNTRIIPDIRGLTVQQGAVADYELAKLLNAWDSLRTVEMAALAENDAYLPYGRFFETAARNSGLNLRVFSNFNAAHQWISSK